MVVDKNVAWRNHQTIGMAKVRSEKEKRRVDFQRADFGPSGLVSDDQLDDKRRTQRPPILVSKAAHPRPIRMLNYHELVPPAVSNLGKAFWRRSLIMVRSQPGGRNIGESSRG